MTRSQWILGSKKASNRSYWLDLSMVGMTGFEPAASSSRTKRATKLCHIPQSQEILYAFNLCLSTLFLKIFEKEAKKLLKGYLRWFLRKFSMRLRASEILSMAVA